ncbi:hypothetical protein diail_11576 [Diaporthe ilicicola]|nr:hypothetical protein diail_11576 [Diaporthe ilicicola]
MEQHREILATIETWDNGKPYSVSLNEDLTAAIETLRYYGGFVDKVFYSVIETTPEKFAYTVHEPVCGQIIPWNYPLAMAAWKLGPALACGNTVVLKPAEQTPLSILYVANLVAEAGFPPGVVNVVNGLGAVAGAALASHPDVDKIAFTGSTSTARQIMKMASHNLKNITLESGGKSPLIMFEDAEIGKQEGAKLELGGQPFSSDGKKGYFVEPTVFTSVSPQMRIFQEEVFGPFVVICRFKTEEDAIAVANDTQYGLGSALFTTNLTRAHTVAKKIQAGTVWINSSNDSDWRIPFGGVKQSGIGT